MSIIYIILIGAIKVKNDQIIKLMARIKSGTITAPKPESRIGFKSTTVQVENKGPSGIEGAEVYILWPSMREEGAPLLYLTAQPSVEGAGTCQYVSDVNTYNIKVRNIETDLR